MPHLTLHLQRTPLHFHQLFRYRQAQHRTAIGPGVGIVCLFMALEKLLQLIGRNTYATIRNLKQQRYTPINCTRMFYTYFHTPLFRKLYAVSAQVHQYLVHPERVTYQYVRYRVINMG